METNVIHNQDCIEGMGELPDKSIDTIITDPPYGLNFMGKEWDDFTDNEVLQKWTKEWSKEALQVAKPGAILLCFGGTRTWHRIACGIEDAGWEIRDTVIWAYGSGFPKSHNIGKAVDKKNFQNWLEDNPEKAKEYKQELEEAEGVDEIEKVKRKYQKMSGNVREIVGENPNYREKRENNLAEMGGKGSKYKTAPATPEAKQWEGYGTALKPAWEPIIMAMKPYENTYAENALEYDVAGLNIDGARVGKMGGETHKGGFQKKYVGDKVDYENDKGVKTDKTPKGRFPANLIHDGSEEVEACFPETKTGGVGKGKDSKGKFYGGGYHNPETYTGGDQGSASRYFKRIKYSAKASKKERNSDGKVDNNHPTVKPLALMQYLVELTKMPNEDQIYLDPFIGSGTTGMVVRRKNRNYIGYEKEEEYVEIARARIQSIEDELI